jgi:YD repeat-containing protein
MRTVQAAATVLMFSLTLNFPLAAQSVQSDVAQQGLRGPVRMLYERRANYGYRGGSWVQQELQRIRKVEFNEAGFKIVEYAYGDTTQRTTYAYDQAGVLAEKEEFSGSRRTSSWKRTAVAAGSKTEWVRFNNQGEVYNRQVWEFDTAGNKTFEISYDAKGNVTRRWQHRKSGEGSVTSLSVSWGQAERTDYDSQGRITAMRRGSGKSLQRWSYIYDAQGRLAQARYTDNNDKILFYLYTFSYDTAGKLVEMAHTQTSESSEVPVDRRRYSYSGTGILLSETSDWYDSEGTLDRTWMFRYDPDGNVVEKKLTHAGRPFSCRWTYSYDVYGNLTEETFYDSYDRIARKNEMTWDKKGHKLSERSSGRLVDPGLKVLYEYDGEGRLLETVRFDLEDRQLSRESNRYNYRGDLLETAMYNPDGSLVSSTRYDYSYDERGNWIERMKLVTNNAAESYDRPTERVTRQIEYH